MNAHRLMALDYIANNPYCSNTDMSHDLDIPLCKIHVAVKSLLEEDMIINPGLTKNDCRKLQVSSQAKTHWILTNKGKEFSENRTVPVRICGMEVSLTAPQIAQIRKMTINMEAENRANGLKALG